VYVERFFFLQNRQQEMSKTRDAITRSAPSVMATAITISNML
jgi:hypothetical protein